MIVDHFSNFFPTKRAYVKCYTTRIRRNIMIRKNLIMLVVHT